MKRFLLDTGIAGLYINRDANVHGRAKQEVACGSRNGLGIPVLAELYYGVEFSQSREKSLQKLRAALPTLTVWPFTEAAAVIYGLIAANLRRRGLVIQQNDVQIAAIAFSLGNCTVVSKDSDFRAVDGLSVEDWSV